MSDDTNEVVTPGSENMPLNDTRNTGSTEHLHTTETACLFQGDYDFVN